MTQVAKYVDVLSEGKLLRIPRSDLAETDRALFDGACTPVEVGDRIALGTIPGKRTGNNPYLIVKIEDIGNFSAQLVSVENVHTKEQKLLVAFGGAIVMGEEWPPAHLVVKE